MRKILFRGKTLDGGNWVTGSLVCRTNQYKHDETITEILVDRIYGFDGNESYWTDVYEVYPETVGQWTGLIDKRGNKIFEGDILDTPRWIVSYSADLNAGLGMNAGWYLQRDDFESWSELENEPWHEVLGNIWDNPELLERYKERSKG